MEFDSDNLRPIPQITTWRETHPELNTGLYDQQSITNETQATVTITDGGTAYVYTPSQPIPVQSGDIVGIMMPIDEDENMQSVKSLYLNLSESNASTFSCARVSPSTVIVLNSDSCGEPQDEESGYIPMITAIIGKSPNFENSHRYCSCIIFNDKSYVHSDQDLSSSTTSSPAATSLPSTGTANTVAPTSLANPTTTGDEDGTAGSSSTSLTTSPTDTSPIASSNQVIGVVVGAVLAVIAVVLIIALVVLLVVILGRKRRERRKLYDVPQDVDSPQPQNMDNPLYTGIKSNASAERKKVRGGFIISLY